jgi:hypothetical protein
MGGGPPIFNVTKILLQLFYFNLLWYSGYVGRRFQRKESTGCEKGFAEAADQ